VSEWVCGGVGKRVTTHHGYFVPVTQFEVGDVIELLGADPRSIGLKSGRLGVHCDCFMKLIWDSMLLN
jgi:hypothetical protein